MESKAVRRANEVKDALYAAGVHSNEDVYLSIHPSYEETSVIVAIYPNHYTCEGCRSRTLIQKAANAFRNAVRSEGCGNCHVHAEKNWVARRALLKQVLKAARGPFTVIEENSGEFSMHVDIAV